jgi:hypothetical protein
VLPLDRLPDGGDDGVALDREVRAGDRHRAPSPRRVGLPQLHSLARERQGAAVPAPLDADRRHENLDRDTLGLGPLDFLHQAGHLAPRPPVEDPDLRPEPARGARAVHRGVPASDHHHAPPEVRPGALGDLPQDADPGEGQLRPLAVQPGRELRADREEDRVVLASQVGEGEVAAPVPAQAERGPELRDDPDLGVERGPRQAVLGDAVAEHSAGERVGIEERAGVTLLEEVEGGGEPGRPGADDRDALAGGAAGTGQRRARRLEVPVGGVAVERPDGQPLVVPVAAPAALLAQARAHPPERPGERQPLVDPLHRPAVLAARDLVDEARDVETRRAARRAGGDTLPRVVGEEQLDSGAARGADVVARGRYDHAVGGR